MTDNQKTDTDVLVVGTGFGGIYQLDRLREEGFRVRAWEAGTDAGGVWHWNTYPGARVDTYAPLYQFSREDLWRDWNWTELYPGQQELQAYFQYVVDKLDLRSDITFNTRAISAKFDDDERVWIVRGVNSETGAEVSCRTRFLTMCLGFGSKPYTPDIPGLDTFAGQAHHTARWPKDGLDLAGKRVGVIGTGASGVQVIQTCASEVAELVVFQRTLNMALPMGQRPLDSAENDRMKQSYPEMFAKRASTFAGYDYDFVDAIGADLSDAALVGTLERLWAEGGLKPWLGGFLDALVDPKVNAKVYAFWRSKILPRIKDPKLAEKLAPAVPPHPFGVKRCSLEQGYYEAFNQDNVRLVDLHDTPITKVLPEGVQTTDGTVHALDIIVLATGYDGVTGGLTAIDIQGTDGRSFAEVYEGGIRSAYGKATAGFPNMFYIYGPQSPSALCNGPSCAEFEGDWLVSCFKYLRERGLTRMEAKAEAEVIWAKHVTELIEPTLFPLAKSWYMGVNIPGKHKEVVAYPGGLPLYLEKCEELAANDYKEGFVLS